MKFLKKDINTGLLFFVIFLLILFACFNLYYQKTINDISKDYDEKHEQLTEITAKMVLEEAKTDKISHLKEITEKDIEFLEKDYQELTNENEVLKTEKDIMEQKINGKGEIGSCKASGSAQCPD